MSEMISTTSRTNEYSEERLKHYTLESVTSPELEKAAERLMAYSAVTNRTESLPEELHAKGL